MSDTLTFDQGGYSFIKGVYQYSAGVRANAGYRIVRVRLPRPLPLDAGFGLVEAWLKERQRPPLAFCSCELRSPAPLTQAGFESFNRAYVGRLTDWGIFDGKLNPVARTNVCPVDNPPEEPSLHAFSYTEVSDDARPSFVVAGSAEAPEGKGNYRDHAIRLGETSSEALREKAAFVADEMGRRLAALGVGWKDTTAAHVYCTHDVHDILVNELTPRGATGNGITLSLCRPPVRELEFEMDCRGTNVEYVAG